MSAVATYSSTHSVTYVSENILKSLKDIIRLSGLDPAKFAGEWDTNIRAVRAWLQSGHLRTVELEIFNPANGELVTRWDVEIAYDHSDSDGSFWTDTEALKYNIKKAGVAPSDASYELILSTAPGRPDVAGWGPGQYRSTAGMVRQALGSTIQHGGLGASVSYLRRA